MENAPGGDESRGQMLLWRELVYYGLRSGVAYHDAQDLASQAFIKALAAHDPARGAFAALCRTTHGNLLKNHWRDRKPVEPVDGHDIPAKGDGDPLQGIILGREREVMRSLSERILAALDPEEAAFFLALSDVVREAEKAAVSAASRRLGLEPLKGWDIFRRIQRKARGHLSEFEAVVGREAERAAAPDADFSVYESALGLPRERAGEYRADGMEPLLFLASACADAGFGRFAASLSAEQRKRLATLA